MDTPVLDKQDTKPDYKIIGTRPIRHDGVDKVTGRAIYGADIKLIGMLYGKVLRSPHAHANIKHIDTSAAEKLPGVKAIVTGADFPALESKVKNTGEGSVNYSYLSQNIMAQGKALYHGHAIAAVAATDIHTAEEAIKLIKVEYEVLPPVMDVPTAMAENAPIILSELRTDNLGEKLNKPTNVAYFYQHSLGDLEQGFAQADVVVEREFVTGTVHQGYLEPQNATAQWNADGMLQIFCSTQGAFAVRQETSEILQKPVSEIKVTPLEIGGGFGGKLNVYLEPVASLLSKKASGKPVRMTMTREEVLKATGPTSASVIKVKMGSTNDGKIVAAYAWLGYEAGAFPGSPVSSAMEVILAPYNIPNVTIDGYDVIVNKPKAQAYRAPGGTNAAFASETVINEIADQLGIDQLKMRYINGAKEGTRRATGVRYPCIGYLETLEASMTSDHYNSPLPQPSAPHMKVGRGVASGFWMNWGGKSSASAAVNPDGTVNFIEGSTDIGGSRASLSMQLAEVLGIRAEEVKPVVVGTDQVGYNDFSAGSRTTFGSGYAAYMLGKNIQKQMQGRAALLWDCAADDVVVDGSTYTCGDKSISFKELCEKLDDTGGPMTTSASVDADKLGYGSSFATHVVDVEVDTDTGKVQILRYTAPQDVGKAIHPSYVEGQIQGGVAQGAGWALHEEYVYNKDGLLLNGSLLDYRTFTTYDLPMIDAVIVEVPNPTHPFGVRGVGEVPIVPPAGAIANAIANAIGVRMNVLPMKPGNVLKALGKI